jgi:excisionase family DNA binding protein
MASGRVSVMAEHRKKREFVPKETVIGELYTPKEVAQLLKVTLRTVQEWIRIGKLPAMQYGRIWRVRADDLLKLGRENRKA